MYELEYMIRANRMIQESLFPSTDDANDYLYNVQPVDETQQ